MALVKSKRINWPRLLLKIGLSSAALIVVFRKIDLNQTIQVMADSDLPILLIACFFFILSKALSALRLNYFLRDIGARLTELQNMRLYIIGMFYNLFLPGGIGGDAFKVYILNKNKYGAVKNLIGATVWDRVSGLVALVTLAVGLLAASSFFNVILELIGSVNVQVAMPVLVISLTLVTSYLSTRYFFGQFLTSWFKTTALSLGVQSLQLVCAYFILRGLGIDSSYVDYMALFLVSSIVAVIPFTIGGVGARELVFVLAHEWFGIDQTTAVAFSLLFFLITMLISLFGVLVRTDFETAEKG